MKKPQRKSPNLLRTSPFRRKITLAEKQHRTFVNTAKAVIIATQTLFIVLLVLNSKADKELKAIENRVDTLISTVDNLEYTENYARVTIRRTNLYKDLLENRAVLSQKIEQATSNLPNTIYVDGIEFDRSRFILMAKAYSALDFSLLISNYLDSGLSSEIVIKSARLDPASDMFIVEIEARYT